MTDITIAALNGSEGGFVTKHISGVISIVSGSSGTLTTITPPSGQKARLTYLSLVSTEQPNIDIKIGGVAVATGLTIRRSTTGYTASSGGQFKIGSIGAGLEYIEAGPLSKHSHRVIIRVNSS